LLSDILSLQRRFRTFTAVSVALSLPSKFRFPATETHNGYGDVKTIVHVINFCERLGAQGLFFEDQASPKRCGHIAGKRLLTSQKVETNIGRPPKIS
jgi:hypothetical protein